MAKMVQFTWFLAGQAMAFDVQVFLRAREVPYCRLHDEGLDAPRLGEMAWLKTGEFVTDPGDAVFSRVN
jgi:predicted component of type VI protein secretion system